VLRPYEGKRLTCNAFVDEVDDVLSGCAGQEDFSDPRSLEIGDVGFRDDAAEKHGHVVHAFFAEQIHQLRADSVVGAREDGEADDVDILLDGGRGDHFRRLAQTGVDDFHAGVAEGTRDDFSPAVVAIQPGLGNQDSYLFFWHELGDGDFLVGAEDVAHGVADFAERGVGFGGVEDEGHEVVGALGGGAQGVEAAGDFVFRTVGTEFAEAFGLAMGDGFVDLQNVQVFFFGNE